MYPDELYDEFFAMQSRLNAYNTGVEITGLEEFIKQPIENERIRRGAKFPTPVWLKARGGPADGSKGKLDRIKSLVPFYRQGYIFHNTACCAGLESQLLEIPIFPFIFIVAFGAIWAALMLLVNFIDGVRSKEKL